MKPIHLTTFIALLTFQAAFSQANYFQKVDFQEIDWVNQALGGYMVPGQGINFKDRYYLIPALTSPFKPTGSTEKTNIKAVSLPDNRPIPDSDVRNVVENIASGYNDNVSFEAKSKSIELNFKASLGIIGDINATYSKVRQEETQSKTVQVFYELRKSGQPINGPFNWTDLSQIESIADDNERANTFISQYGSHIITSVSYGFRIEILADYFSTSATERENFSIAMRAWTAKGSASFDYQSFLRTSSLRILCKVNSGGLVPNTSAILRGFDEVNDFLTKLKSGDIKIYAGPVGYNINSYYGTLTSFNNCKKIFTPNDLSKFVGDFPRGIIISWRPSPSNYTNGDPTTGVLLPPDGWAICDGTKGTPDLRTTFIVGEGGEGDNKHKQGDFIGSNITTIQPGQINSRVYWFTDPITTNGPMLGPHVGQGWGNFHTLVSRNTEPINIPTIPRSYVVVYLLKL